MKLTAAIKLLPSESQAACLKETLNRCNEAATWLAELGFTTQTFRQFDLHNLAYRDIREKFNLGAQATVRTIAKVADAFKIDREVSPVFRPDGAQPYDHQILRFTKDGNGVNLWTVEGRITVPIVISDYHKQLFAYRKGEVDLCFVRGNWILGVPCDIPETVEFNAEDWLGIDLGIIQLVTTSDGETYSGQNIEDKRKALLKRRNGLQKKGTKGAKRRLKKLKGKQQRFQSYTNHCISKAVVLTVERTNRGIALEDLKGIRERVSANRSQRARLGNWGFAQMRTFISYKAKRAGVPVLFVDPRNTSIECAKCGYVNKKNRPDQATFSCVYCHHTDNADHNAAVNIRSRALAARGYVMKPEVLAA